MYALSTRDDNLGHDVFHKTSGLYLAGREDGTVLSWDLNAGKEVYRFNADACGVKKVQYLRTGQLLTLSSSNGGLNTPQLKIWDLRAKDQCIFALGRQSKGADKENVDTKRKARYTCVRSHPIDEKILTGTSTGSVVVWDLRSGEAVDYRVHSSADFAMMAANLRDRLPGLDKMHAGNYQVTISYQPADYASPTLIRKSLQDKSNIALTTNWSTFYLDLELQDCEQIIHFPIIGRAGGNPISDGMIIFRPNKGKLAVFVATRSCSDALMRIFYQPKTALITLSSVLEVVYYPGSPESLKDFEVGKFPVWIWMDNPSYYGFPVYGDLHAVKAAEDVALGAAHGFKFASWFGRCLAERAIFDGKTDSDIYPFRLDRPAITDPNFVGNYIV
eukprot:gene17251-17441_t